MDGTDQPETQDPTMLDDSSAHYGLGHSWKGSAKAGSGSGIGRFLDEQLRDHKRALAAEMDRQGVSSPDQLRAVNHGAYDSVKKRIGELLKAGKTLAEAREIARSESSANELPDDEQARADDKYLGDCRVEDLMGTDRRVHAGGGGGNVTKLREEPIMGVCPKCNGMGAKPIGAPSVIKSVVVTGCDPCEKCLGTGQVKTGTRTVMVQLMGAKSAGGGGGSGGKMKRGKKPTIAHDGGDHVVLSSYDGRFSTIEDESRDRHRTARVSPQTDDTLKSLGVNTAGILAAVAQMRLSNDPNARIALEQLLSFVPEPKVKGAA